MNERNLLDNAANTDHGRRRFESTRQLLDDGKQSVERIERLGKCLFGVAACVVVLHDEHAAAYEERQTAPSAMQLFCAGLPVSDSLLVAPAVSSSAPFQAALGNVGNLNVLFYALHPVRDSDQQIVGNVCLVHDRPRAFTNGDRQLLLDLVAMVERELHLKFMIAFRTP